MCSASSCDDEFMNGASSVAGDESVNNWMKRRQQEKKKRPQYILMGERYVHVFGFYWVEYLKALLRLCLPMALTAQLRNYLLAKWIALASDALIEYDNSVSLKSMDSHQIPLNYDNSSSLCKTECEWKCFHFFFGLRSNRMLLEISLTFFFRLNKQLQTKCSKCLNTSDVYY